MADVGKSEYAVIRPLIEVQFPLTSGLDSNSSQPFPERGIRLLINWRSLYDEGKHALTPGALEALKEAQSQFDFGLFTLMLLSSMRAQLPKMPSDGGVSTK